MASPVKSSIFLGFTTTAFVAISITYASFRHSEMLLAIGAQRFIMESPYQGGATEVAQTFSRIFCAGKRHSYCSVSIVSMGGDLMASVPTIEVQREKWGLQKIELRELQFQPPLIAQIVFRPSLFYFMAWSSVALILFAVAALFAWLIINSLRKKTETEKLKLQLRLRNTEAELGRLATQVAHDIRAPLAALKVALAQYKESGPKESSELMSSAITRIAGIADDLLLNDTQIDKDNFEYFHASQAIESIFDEKKLTSSGCEFNLVIGAEFVVFGSKPYFQRAVSNFINNSVEAKKNGTLRISALVDRNSIIIEDDGKGMAHEAVQNLLRDNDNNVTTKTYGFGLGFKGARSLLQKMSLSVEVQSSLGHGTKVIISKNKT